MSELPLRARRCRLGRQRRAEELRRARGRGVSASAFFRRDRRGSCELPGRRRLRRAAAASARARADASVGPAEHEAVRARLGDDAEAARAAVGGERRRGGVSAISSAGAKRSATVSAPPAAPGCRGLGRSAARRSTLAGGVDDRPGVASAGSAVRTPSFDTSGCRTGISAAPSACASGTMRVTISSPPAARLRARRGSARSS